MTHNIADEIERLAGEATIAPWLWTDDNGPEFPKQWRIHPGVLLADGNSGTPGGDEIDHANAALIVALRNNLPAIICALRSEARLREALECIAGYDDMPAREWEKRFPSANIIMAPLDLPDVSDGLCEIARQALSEPDHD